MKKRILVTMLAGIAGACVLTGCQKAPATSAQGDIGHAKSSLESNEAESIADVTGTSGADLKESGRSFDALIGTEENGIRICAEVPTAPQTVPTLTLRERDDLNAEKLKELLDSESGNVKDITAEYLAQSKKELSELDEEEKIEWIYFGDDSLLIFSDGSKEASFARNTNASYEDKKLKADCGAIYKAAPEIDITNDGENASAKFSFARAKELLVGKLKVLDIGEVNIFKAFYYEKNGFAFYELRFTPSYNNICVASEFGQIQKGEVHPLGTAWVAENGVATLSLIDCCGTITQRSDNVKILTFAQAADILEKYLENNVICGVPQAKLTQVELVYYPIFQNPELVLKPSWHIYVPLEQKLESKDEAWNMVFEKGAATNIYIDAVTGELIKAED